MFVAAISFFGGSKSSGITLSATPLTCVSMNYQECKIRPEIVNVNSDKPFFFFLILKQVNAVAVVTIPMIHMPKCVLLVL